MKTRYTVSAHVNDNPVRNTVHYQIVDRWTGEIVSEEFTKKRALRHASYLNAQLDMFERKYRKLDQ